MTRGYQELEPELTDEEVDETEVDLSKEIADDPRQARSEEVHR